MNLLPQALIDGILIGGIYITFSIGFSLAFGVMHIIDFAVGEWVMLGAFLGFYLNNWLGIDTILFLPVVFFAFGCIGYLLQPIIYRVLSGTRGNPRLMGLVFTFGIALMIQGLGLTFFGFYSHTIKTFLTAGCLQFSIGGTFITIPIVRLAALIYALLITFGLSYLLKKTDFGVAVRAVAQHREAASLMGINIKKTSSYIYAIYVGISAMTGILLGSVFSINAQMGGKYTILAFFVVVLAGMGYLPGVPWAAFLLGIVQSLFLIYFNPDWTLLAVFTILFLILILSPKGLFGRGI
ncbi:MAG: branched-chain amino acid ABC transporter permease [Syntrophobacteraceae bacterium]